MLLWDLLGLFPGTDYESFNYEWVISKLKDLKDSVAAASASEQAAADSASDAADSAGMALLYRDAAKDFRDEAQGFANDAQDSADSISGVVTQVNTNTNRIDNLIANAGDGTIPSELSDIRVGQDGLTYSTAGDAVRSNDFLDRKAAEIAAYNWQAFRSGESLTAYAGFPHPATITDNDGQEGVRTDKKEYVTPYFNADEIGTLKVESGYRATLFLYDDNQTFISKTSYYAGTHNITPQNGLYRARVNNTTWTAMTPEQVANSFTLTYTDTVNARISYLENAKKVPQIEDFAFNGNNTRAIASGIFINNESDTIIESDDKVWWSFYVNAVDPATNTETTLTSWTWYYLIPKGTPYRCGLRKSNDAAISEGMKTAYDHFAFTPVDSINTAEAVKKTGAAKKLFISGNTGTESTLLNFAQITDIHTDQARWNRFNHFVNNNAIDAVIATGDYVEDPTDAEITIANNMFDDLEKPYYAVLGNHDRIGHQTTITNAQVLQKYQCFPLGLYYSTMLNEKIKLIVLNQYADENQNTRYTQTQMTWFCSEMEDANTNNYHVIIAMHEPEYMPVYNDDGFYQKYPKSSINFNAPICPGMIQTIVNAYKNGVPVNESYNGLAASATFSSPGKFIGFMCGHMHRDFTGYASQFTNQLIMMPVSTCSSVRVGNTVYKYTDIADLDRNIHTNNQDAFNVYSIDTDNQVVKIVRIGADMNDMLIPRSTVTFSY